MTPFYSAQNDEGEQGMNPTRHTAQSRRIEHSTRHVAQSRRIQHLTCHAARSRSIQQGNSNRMDSATPLRSAQNDEVVV